MVDRSVQYLVLHNDCTDVEASLTVLRCRVLRVLWCLPIKLQNVRDPEKAESDCSRLKYKVELAQSLQA